IRNTERAVGTMLGHEATKRYGEAGLAPETIDITLTGTAGQSLGAFLPAGITLRLEGAANDYVGKGLSGGDIVVRPARTARFPAEQNVIAGNVIGYGATSGTLFIRGRVGERFLVRNSGAVAVGEGVGDHALEDMAGGVAAILGTTGRNRGAGVGGVGARALVDMPGGVAVSRGATGRSRGAGMSGGVAYVHRLHRDAVNRDSLAAGELELLPLDRADIELLRSYLQLHVEKTDSALARRMLDDWDATASAFVKAQPRDYAPVIQTRQPAIADRLDPAPDVASRRI